jgi:glycerate-2-kinase
MVAGPRAGHVALPGIFEWFDAGHPDPNEASRAAGRRALALARSSEADATLLVLLSGGASAMLVAMAPGVTAEDARVTAKLLMDAGMAIDALNCVRKHLSSIKGGRLGAAAPRSLTLAISDVHAPVADDPSVIGSGPTVPDPTTYEGALEIVNSARARRGPGATPDFPPGVIQHLTEGARGLHEETIKPGDPRLSHAVFAIVGNRSTAIEGARSAAESLGYSVEVFPEATTGEARSAGAAFLQRARERARRVPGPLCVIAAGETTVTVKGSGRGGRNQEFALGAASGMAELERPALLASAGTDGIDGPTDAAGAIVDPTTLSRAREAGRSAERSLAQNDAYPFFSALGDLILLGPTGTNVGDLQVFLTGG